MESRSLQYPPTFLLRDEAANFGLLKILTEENKENNQ
jgi:hypothetical protein